MTKMKTFLTSNDFDFIIIAMNDASLEITKKQEAKKPRRKKYVRELESNSEGYNRTFSPTT
jgi:hypothetical protein